MGRAPCSLLVEIQSILKVDKMRWMDLPPRERRLILYYKDEWKNVSHTTMSSRFYRT